MLARNRYEVTAEVKRVISDTLSVPIEQVNQNTRIAEDLNATSMDIVTLAMSLDDAFSIEFDLEKIPTSNVTVEWIVEYICSHEGH